MLSKWNVKIQTNNSSSNWLFIVHAGSKNSFMENALLILKCGLSTRDYHGQKNSNGSKK